MNKSMKFLIFGILIVILINLSFFAASAYAWETYDYSIFDNDTYVYDIGDNFYSIDLEYYNGVLQEMRSEYGITYTFIIVDDYDIVYEDDTVWDFAALIREHGGFGQDYISAAVTVGPGERDFAIYTLGKGQTVMTDRYVDELYDGVRACLSENDWDGAFLAFIDLTKKITDDYYSNNSKINIGGCILFAVISGIIVSVIALVIELVKHKPVKKATHADLYVKDENVNMSRIEDRYLRSHEVRTRVSSSSNGGGGSGGGRSHTGSSGRSGGGRSGRF